MGVYIKGMEMPKKCQYCPISHWNTLDIITGCELVDRYVSKTDKDFWDNDRPSWCPLIEVPEPHGDLIDRDALPTSRVEWEDIVNAPTIIKANESDMDSFIRIFEEDDEKDGMDSFIRILKD